MGGIEGAEWYIHWDWSQFDPCQRWFAPPLRLSGLHCLEFDGMGLGVRDIQVTGWNTNMDDA